MWRSAYLPTILFICALGDVFIAQQLVIAVERTKQYHRPSCPVLRDAKGVLAMTRGQAEARQFKPHPDCDPANPAGASGETSTAPAERQPPVYVYTAAGDTRYHRESCAKLSKERRKELLEEAGKKRWPCPVCRPPIRKREPAVPRR